jgi:hypothetical protein
MTIRVTDVRNGWMLIRQLERCEGFPFVAFESSGQQH